jgi:hypothetical protein
LKFVTVSNDQVSLSPQKDALTYERHVTSPHKRLLKTYLSTDPAGFRLPNFLVPIAFHNQLKQDGA